MGFPILVRCRLYIEPGPWPPSTSGGITTKPYRSSGITNEPLISCRQPFVLSIYPHPKFQRKTNLWYTKHHWPPNDLSSWMLSTPTAGAMHVVPDNKVHVAHMRPTWVLSAPSGSHVDPMYLVIRSTSMGYARAEAKQHSHSLIINSSSYDPLYICNAFQQATYYSDVIMSAMAFQIACVSVVYSTICSVADQRKHQSPVSLAFVRGIHRWIPRTKCQ